MGGVFDPQAVEIEKQMLKKALEDEVNDKRIYCLRQANREFFGDSPAAVRQEGYLEEVDGLTPEQLTAAYREMLRTASIELIVLGCDDAQTAAIRDALLAELIDRYGDPPPSVSDLVNVSLVRVQATAVGVYEVTQKKDTIVLNLEHLDVPMIRGLLVAFNGRVTAGAGSKPYLSVTLHPDEKPLELLQSILKAMAEILNGKDKPQESK